MFSHPETNVASWKLSLGASVADLGSGSGHYALALARAVGDAGKVYAVDIQKDLLAKVKNEGIAQGLRNIEVVWGDIEKIGGTKIKDEALDAVLLSNILFQVKEKETLAKEASRILKKEGTLAVIDWQDSFGGLGPHSDAVFPKEHAQKLLESVGLSLEREFSAGDHHYGLVFKKS
jgi:ubiquinone/menaquinone biosynthesis C-methylase UbiE